MSKGQRSNKEAKKPKQAAKTATPLLATTTVVPFRPATLPPPRKK